MRPIKGLQAAVLLTLSLCGAGQVQAVDAVHTITITFKATASSEEVVRGDTITTRPVSFRATTRDFIEEIGQAKSTTFGPRAQLLLIRRNIEAGEADEPSIVIRETGREDTDVTELIRFGLDTPVQTGTFHIPTGRARTTALAIGGLIVEIPESVSLFSSGISKAKGASVNVDGEETNTGLVSLSTKLAGQGTFVFDAETEVFAIIEGTLTIGAPRLVSNPL